MKRFGSATWDGGLREGRGSVSTESHALEPILVRSSAATVKSRAPIRKSYSGRLMPPVFTMSFVRLLRMANFVPEQVDSKSEVVIEKDADGFSITSVHLTFTAKIPGIDRATFQSIAAKAKAGCPISKLMNVEIGFETTLLS